MSALVIIGLASIAITVAFTMFNYFSAQGDGQTRREALAEAWINVAIGFSINYAANLVLLPMVGARMNMVENLWLGSIFTAISVIRSFVIRRYFNAQLVALSRSIAAATAKS